MNNLITYLIILIGLISIQNTYGQNTLSPEMFYGKWTMCYTSKLDTIPDCNGEWKYEFFEDGTFRENRQPIYNGVKHEFVYGTWSFENGVLTIDENDSEWHEAGPITYNLKQINLNLYYEKCIEGKKRKKIIYVFVYFKKVEE